MPRLLILNRRPFSFIFFLGRREGFLVVNTFDLIKSQLNYSVSKTFSISQKKKMVFQIVTHFPKDETEKNLY